MRKNAKMIFATVLSLTPFFSATFNVHSYAEGRDEGTSLNVYNGNSYENRMDENVERVEKLLKENHMSEDQLREARWLYKNEEYVIDRLEKFILYRKPEWKNLSPSERIDKAVEFGSHSFELAADRGEGGYIINPSMDEEDIRSILERLGFPENKEFYYQHMDQWFPLSSVPL